jgi:2-hydroxy-6-oxonona-2,4-dienedioate hydrolase
MTLTRRNLLASAAFVGAGAVGAALVQRACAVDLAAARARIATGSRIVATRAGPVEIGESPGDRPLLMIHGTGGGFDQGLHFAHRLSAAGWRVIAPSRFGYLRTPMPADASSDAQADALAALLDALGIERLPVLGGSAGALSALAFALRHPQRCSALVPIVPASYVPGRPATPAATPWATVLTEAMLRSDFLFWCGLRSAPAAMTKALLATDAAVVAAASTAEQDRVRRVLWNILPVSQRADGILNDARLSSQPAPLPLARIVAPTLAVSAEDDRFGTIEAARHIAATVPGAQLVAFRSGGHVWAGHDAELHELLQRFLERETASPRP